MEELQRDQRKLGEQAETLEKGVSDLTQWKIEAAELSEVQAQELQGARSQLQETRKDLDDAGRETRELGNQLEAVTGRAEELSYHYESCRKSFHGLGKGLEGTYKRIALGETNLPLTVRPSSALPQIRPGTGNSTRSTTPGALDSSGVRFSMTPSPIPQ